MNGAQKKKYQAITHAAFSGVVVERSDVQEAYKIIRNKQENNIDFCLEYLLTMSQNGLIHHLVGMKDLTTVENQYIFCLNKK